LTGRLPPSVKGALAAYRDATLFKVVYARGGCAGPRS
jgi:hypothetical protein